MSTQDPLPSTAYNDRLFSGRGLRRFYHRSRFEWARKKVEKCVGTRLRLIELGCYDGRLLDTLDGYITDYVGLDANWAGGLDLARRKYRDRPEVTLIETSQPAALNRFRDASFNAAAALETLEHLPPKLVPKFLDQIQRVTRGYVLVTVPNELGPIFLVKYLAKRILYGDGDRYSFAEVVAASLRRSHKIERNQHKGFDYRHVIAEIGKRFEIIEIDGIASLGLPAALAPTIGIFAKSLPAE